MTKIKNNKLLIAIGTLSVIILMAIIYAAFTGQLNINGTANVRDSKWDIHIVESGQLEPSNTLSSSAKVLTKPTVSGLSISDFALSLTTPGDYIEYTFHVINDGDYDAILSDLDKAGVTCTANGSTSDPEAVKVCDKLEYTLKYDGGADVTEGDTILSKQTQTMVLTIKYQEFDEPSLLPNTNVSISGLGIDISYSQSGSAKVNEDGTTPWVDPYSHHVGDQIIVTGETYHVIADSLTADDYVVALKDNPLTVEEVTAAGGTARDIKYDGSIGGMAYHASSSTYATSDIKSVVDAWAISKFNHNELKTIDGYDVRLISFDEAYSFGYGEPQSPCGPYCGVINYPKTDAVPDWLFDSNYMYWTMSSKEGYSSNVMYVSIYGLSDSNVSSTSNAVRPVINVYKSAIQNNS